MWELGAALARDWGKLGTYGSSLLREGKKGRNKKRRCMILREKEGRRGGLNRKGEEEARKQGRGKREEKKREEGGRGWGAGKRRERKEGKWGQR